jgi:hypothetical protein
MMTATRSETNPIKLTKAQAAWVQWALYPMVDFWTDEEEARGRDGKVYSESDLPILNGLELTLSPVQEINSDLIYRMEVQAVDIATENEKYSSARAANAVAEKIRADNPELAALKHGGGWI